MDWIRENKSLATIVGVFAVGGLGMGGVLLMSHFGYADSLEQLSSIAGKVASQEKAALYPSAANVDALAEKVSSYEDAVSGLGDVLLKLQPPVKDITDTDFVAKLKLRIAETRQKAGDAVKLPKDFAFGFDAYTKSLPPSPEAARQLNDYFEAVDAVISLAISSGIISLDGLQRSELAVEKPASATPPPVEEPKKGKAKATASASKIKGGKGSKPPKEIAKVVERRRLNLVVSTDQKALQALINALASPSKMPFFTVVRAVRIENEKQEGPLRNAPMAVDVPFKAPEPVGDSKPEGTADAAAAPKVEVITAPKPAPADAVAVMGKEALKVSLDIDLVRFLAPSPEAASAQ